MLFPDTFWLIKKLKFRGNKRQWRHLEAQDPEPINGVETDDLITFQRRPDDVRHISNTFCKIRLAQQCMNLPINAFCNPPFAVFVNLPGEPNNS